MKLQNKLLLIFVPLGMLACGMLLFLTKRAIHQVVMRELADRVTLRADALEDSISPAVISNDEVGALAVLQTQLERLGGSYAAVLEPSGRIGVHTNVALKGSAMLEPSGESLIRSDKPVAVETHSDGRHLLHVAIPLWHAPSATSEDLILLEQKQQRRRWLGTLVIGIPLENALNTENQIVRKFTFILLVILASFVALALFLLRRILLPIRWLGDATEKITRGEYDMRLPIPSKDELGDLAKRFNLMSAELERRTKELYRSNRELEQFAHVASHDLQEPLRMVTSYMQLLSLDYKDKLDEGAEEYMRFAIEGAKRMKSLIDALLTYSRIGQKPPNFAPTDFSIPARHAMENLKVSIGETAATVTVDELPTLPADEIQITVLFQNLIGNAIKFRKNDEPPRVHISARQEHGQWIFEVSDNGIGIEHKYFDKIFVIFQRLHGREKYPGTGIGLAVCKRIVERHGGKIWVESKPNEGSKFYFTIRGGNANEGQSVEQAA